MMCLKRYFSLGLVDCFLPDDLPFQNTELDKNPLSRRFPPANAKSIISCKTRTRYTCGN